MCWWWFFTFIHNCVWIFLFNARNVENLLKSHNEFQWTTKHVFWQAYFLHMWPKHLKLNILNPLNIFFYQMVYKMNPLPCNPFLQSFKTLKFLFDLVFHQVHPMNIYFHKRGNFFSCTKRYKSIVGLYAFFFIPLKKNVFYTLDYFSLRDSKWHFHSIQFIFKYFY
jgi:hypothetical protein